MGASHSLDATPCGPVNMTMIDQGLEEHMQALQYFVDAMTPQDLTIFNGAVFVAWVSHDALTFKLWKEDASTRGKFFLATLLLHLMDTILSAIMMWYVGWGWASVMRWNHEETGWAPCARAWGRHGTEDSLGHLTPSGIRITDGTGKLAFTLLTLSSEYRLPGMALREWYLATGI
jgi:hypothetical protein